MPKTVLLCNISSLQHKVHSVNIVDVRLDVSVNHTVLDTGLQMIDDGSENGGQAHDLSALRQTQNKQLIPASSYQSRVTLLPTHTHREREMTHSS